MEKKNTEGLVLKIQRMSTEDGPGLRTTIFMKGCPLRCRWCHNPESFLPKQEIEWFNTKCLMCGMCEKECPNKAIRIDNQNVIIDRKICLSCEACTEKCPSSALELLGSYETPQNLFSEVVKDINYFKSSDGGVTISGGEPTLQADFLHLFLKMCKNNGIHTALDSCGYTKPETLGLLLPYVDLLLYDIKIVDSKMHKRVTGVENSKILNNLRLISKQLRSKDNSLKLWIRTPIVPGITDNNKTLMEIAKFIKLNLDGLLSRWELCTFNNLCSDKYKRLGLKWSFNGAGLLDQNKVYRLYNNIKKDSKINPDLIFLKGMTKNDDNESKQIF